MVPLARGLTAADLAGFVRSHRVCWETTVHREATPHGLRTIGYDVVLMAACLPGEGLDPGSARAFAVYEWLREIARQVIPDPCEESVTLSGFEPSFHLRSTTAWTREVQMTIEIRHRDGDYFGPIDAPETRCVRRIEEALRARGIPSGAWSTPYVPALAS
jgi:hypothetical protein